MKKSNITQRSDRAEKQRDIEEKEKLIHKNISGKSGWETKIIITPASPKINDPLLRKAIPVSFLANWGSHVTQFFTGHKMVLYIYITKD